MKTKAINLLWLFLFFAFLLAACKPKEENPEEDKVVEIYTSVAQTVAARPTETAIPTATLLPPTPAILPSATLFGNGNGRGNGGGAGIPTSTPPSATETVCKDAIYMRDITVPDGTILSPGESFDKTWLIFNGGTCTWEADYTLGFLSGSQMSGVPHAVGSAVPPNTQIEVTVSMVAPLEAGSYTGYWQMTDSAGTKFGNAIYVMISVSGDATATFTPAPTEDYTPTPTFTPVPSPTDTPAPTETVTFTPVSPSP